MKLIIGGAYQGKKAYALEHFNGMELTENFHLTALDMVKTGVSPLEYMREHLHEYTEKVIICDDISCGVVPIDPLTRRWREELSRVLAFIAAESDEVIRVFCGLGTRLK